jgi:microcompartment protein CcmK/EutM
MRLAQVKGRVTLNTALPDWPVGALLICEAMDAPALASGMQQGDGDLVRQKPMPESLVVLDQIGAGVDDLIAISEGREAAMPFHPTKRPIDAYCVAILDTINVDTSLLV